MEIAQDMYRRVMISMPEYLYNESNKNLALKKHIQCEIECSEIRGSEHKATWPYPER